MFSSSVRRATRLPAIALPTSSSQSGSAVRARGGRLPALIAHQPRRYSSSKPPVPPSDGSRGIDTSSQTPSKSVGPSNGDKREGKSKRRGSTANKSKHDAFMNLPSVPSTQHLHPPDIHVASFFSIHRPMSITASIPPNSSPDAFSAIFESKKSAKSRHGDVINTLSSAIHAIEGESPRSGRQQHYLQGRRSSDADRDLRAALSQSSANNAESNSMQLDGLSVEELRASIEEFAKSLRPFHPPPAPVPMEEAGISESVEADEAAADQEVSSPRERSYSTVLTVTETSHGDGSKTYEAYTTPFVRVEDSESLSAGKALESDGSQVTPAFLTSLRIRQVGWGGLRQRRMRDMHAISVRRQRKLKMKKHKHRKRLRLTRMQRRKTGK